jgi:DNA invertase Pin-like site-specific DNA recombinase
MTESVLKRSFTKAAAKPPNQAAGAVLGYGRVSREGQDLAQQRAALRAAGCTRLFEEKASGGRWDRPELQRLLDHLRPGDVVVVWKLDRLSRSLKDLLYIMEKIGEAGAGFRSLTEHIDTTTPAGRMMMQMVGAFAEFERAMIRERTSAGLAAARAEGRIGGRRKKLDDTKRREIAEAVISGRKTAAQMARSVATDRVPYRCRSCGRGCALGARDNASTGPPTPERLQRIRPATAARCPRGRASRPSEPSCREWAGCPGAVA